jgi:hypothetical protein
VDPGTGVSIQLAIDRRYLPEERVDDATDGFAVDGDVVVDLGTGES